MYSFSGAQGRAGFRLVISEGAFEADEDVPRHDVVAATYVISGRVARRKARVQWAMKGRLNGSAASCGDGSRFEKIRIGR
jgi:hypothetical protein